MALVPWGDTVSLCEGGEEVLVSSHIEIEIDYLPLDCARFARYTLVTIIQKSWEVRSRLDTHGFTCC